MKLPVGWSSRFKRRACRGDQLPETRDFPFIQRSIHGSGEHLQDFSASRARGEVVFPSRDLVRSEQFFVVRRNQLGVGAIHGVALRQLIQSFAHAPGECFFPAAIARFVLVHRVRHCASFSG
jgi:hypothetical protein